MKNFFTAIMLMMLTCNLQVWPQQVNRFTVAGKVTGVDGVPLAGAGVLLQGTTRGTMTDAGGNYLLGGFPGGNMVLVFTFLGYESVTREIKISSDTIVDVVLAERALMMDDVIIRATRAGNTTPFAYTNISSEKISGLNTGQDIPFILGLTPSLVETSEAGNGVGYTNLRIRGTDASRINVTIDGIPLNDAESQQVFWVDLPDLASSVDNIQVQRGVGTSSNGAGAFGASINIKTKGIEQEPYAEINSAAGSFNTFKNSIALGSGLIDHIFAFSMRLSDLRSDGYIDRTGSDHQSAFISGIFRTDKSLLKANLILGKEHTGIGWWGTPKEMLDVDRRYNPAGEYTDEDGSTEYYSNESDNYLQKHFQLLYSRALGTNLSLQSALHYTRGTGYYEEYKEDRLIGAYGLPPVVLGDSIITSSDVIQRKWLANDFYGLITSLNYTGSDIDASIGGGFNLYDGDHFGRIIWMRNPGNTEIDHQWYLNNGMKREVSLYSKVNYSPAGQISLFGDLQYRYVDYAMRGPDDDFKDLEQRHTYNFFNPKAGVFWKISPANEAFLSLSVANREPSRADFKEAAGDLSATPRAERLYDLESGFRSGNKWSSLAVTLFMMLYKDQLVPTGELSNVGYPIMTNVGRSYRAGIEFTGGVQAAAFLTWDFSLTVSKNKILDFTEYYTDYNTSDWSAEYKSKSLGKVDIAYSPGITGSSDAGFRFARALNLHLITKYVGKQYLDNTMSEERRINPYLINNARIDFQPQVSRLKSLQIQFVINNLLNAEYESNAYGGNWYEDGIEKTWSYYFPQAGINYMVRLGFKF